MPRRRSEQDSDWTRRFRRGDFESEDAKKSQRFSNRSKFAQQVKMQQTAELRAGNQAANAELDALPLGEIIQVHSLYLEVLSEGAAYLCVGRRTQQRLSDSQPVVGDLVRIRKSGRTSEFGLPEAVIEQILPRKTLLLRQDSFHKHLISPIVANAQQMLIVASILAPRVKWGLVDRMLIAAQSGGLEPVLCLNKIDLAQSEPELLEETSAVLAHFQSLGVKTLATSTTQQSGLQELRAILQDKRTVLAGHSGVGKSSLINAIAPEVDIRVGDVSHFNEKGRHTTTSSRRYVLPFGGFVIDTPGVRQFGLVQVAPDDLITYFPDVADETAPDWRIASYENIRASL